jgi:hypothetical protein
MIDGIDLRMVACDVSRCQPPVINQIIDQHVVHRFVYRVFKSGRDQIGPLGFRDVINQSKCPEEYLAILSQEKQQFRAVYSVKEIISNESNVDLMIPHITDRVQLISKSNYLIRIREEFLNHNPVIIVSVYQKDPKFRRLDIVFPAVTPNRKQSIKEIPIELHAGGPFIPIQPNNKILLPEIHNLLKRD